MMTTDNTISKVADRLKKLLKLAKSDNANEAALAAQRAADLMAEYNMTEASLRLDDEARPAEPIVKDHKITADKKKVAWKGTVASAVAYSMGGRMYWTGGTIRVFGRVSAVQAIEYTCQYLWREIDTLADAAWKASGNAGNFNGPPPRRWKNSFRIGAANAISVRLHEQLKAKQAASAPLVEEIFCETAPETPVVNTRAPALVESDAQEVYTEYNAFAKGFRTARVGTISSSSGYGEGRKAGQSISLGGGRGALGAGMTRLGGR